MSGPKQEKPVNEITPLLEGEEDFRGHIIREWTLEQFVLIMPVLEAMIDGIQKRGISWQQIASLFDEKSKSPEGQDPQDEKIGVVGGAKIAFAILPQIPDFLRISLGEAGEVVNALDFPLSMTLVLRIIGKNFAHFQSFFVELAREVGALRAEVETTLSKDASQ